MEKAELAPREEQPEKPLVPVASAPELVEAMRRFEQIKQALIVPDLDTYTVQGVSRIRKSGWRKLALAFGISDELVNERLERDTIGEPATIWHVTVRAYSRGGRSVIGVGSASSRERQFAHPEHDLHALAHTRAKSRAIADMLGSSDQVAEELEEPDMSTHKSTNVGPTEVPKKAPPSSSGLHGQQAAVVWDFLDKVLGEDLADHVQVDALGNELLVTLPKDYLEADAGAFVSVMHKWGYGVHESEQGLTARISRPKG